MKRLYIGALCLVADLISSPICAQLNNGGINAYFGIDADTKSNYVKYGPLTGSIASDDWFSPSLTGNNVIDTSNAATYLSMLQAGSNISFNKRMSALLFAKLSGKLWLDAAYGRDYIAAASLKDSTAFTSVDKNGDNPNNWTGGVSSFPDKDDLVDVFAHMRRDGVTVHDSLWLFTGVSTYGTSGSRYFDVELYKNNFSYLPATGVFSSAGPDAGHTQWLFDASGNIIQTGDMIIAVNFTPGSAPVADVRIWVSQTTFTSITPAYFNFGGSFNGSTPAYGYASIVSKTGATAFGAGISNYSATSAQDTTYATPWGTAANTGGANWASQYQSLQFIEVGLNLTRIGVDPALYSSTLSPCQSLFSDIFFKSRASNSFTADMHDFVTPMVFLRSPVMDYSLRPDTLRCNRSVGTIQITNNTTMGYYTWQTTNGNISGSNTDSSQININKPGTYFVSASPALGCPATRKDTVVIPIDTFPPEASIKVSLIGGLTAAGYFQFYGGDTIASNYSTPFGGSHGLLWNWSGPQAFTSSIQNPRTTDTAWGTYQLIVTEKRNGCTDTAVTTLTILEFGLLANSYFILSGSFSDHSVLLSWKDNGQNNAEVYEIERSVDGRNFDKIGELSNSTSHESNAVNFFSFADNYPNSGYNLYRIKLIATTGQILYSNVIRIKAGLGNQQEFYLTTSQTGKAVSLICNCNENYKGVVAIYNIAGQVLLRKDVQLNKGSSVIELPTTANMKNSIIVVTLFANSQLLFAQKTIF
jgi:hypothetical protein